MRATRNIFLTFLKEEGLVKNLKIEHEDGHHTSYRWVLKRKKINQEELFKKFKDWWNAQAKLNRPSTPVMPQDNIPVGYKNAEVKKFLEEFKEKNPKEHAMLIEAKARPEMAKYAKRHVPVTPSSGITLKWIGQQLAKLAA